MSFEPLADLLVTDNAPPFRPVLFYHPRLELLGAYSKDCSTVECSATRLHVLSVSYNMHPNWLRKLFGVKEIAGIEVYNIALYAKHYGFSTEHLFPLSELVRRMSEDPLLEFTWTAREKRKVFRYLRRHDSRFMVDLPKLISDFS